MAPLIGGDDDTSGAARLAERIAQISAGAIMLDIAAPVTVRDGLESGVGLIGPSHLLMEFDPVFGVFSSVPFGLGAREFEAWIYHGGGQAIWDEVSATLNMKPLLVGDHGPRVAGWFSETVTGPDSFRNLTMNIAGLGSTALAALGGTAVSLSADKARQGPTATSSFGIGRDLDLGFAEVFPALHTPSLFEPQGAQALFLPVSLWDDLSPVERMMIESAAAAESDHAIAAAVSGEMAGFGRLAEAGVKPVPLSAEVFAALASQVQPAVTDLLAGSSAHPAVHNAYSEFLAAVSGWTAVGDSAFSVARARALGA